MFFAHKNKSFTWVFFIISPHFIIAVESTRTRIQHIHAKCGSTSCISATWVFCLSSFSFLLNDCWLFTFELGKNEYVSINMSLIENVTGLIKGEHLLFYEFGSADSGWPPFSKGFALCSIISHYYISHLLPRFPMGETTHAHTHTYTHARTNDGRHVTHNNHRPLKSQQHILATGQERSLQRQPSTASTTACLVKRRKSPKWHQSRKLWVGGWW